jgi:hypothetical protein
MNHGKTTAERNTGRKSTSAERDRRTLRWIVSKNHKTTTTQVTAELYIHLEYPVFVKNVRRELHKSNIHGRAAVAKLLITVVLRCVNDGVTTIKSGHQRTGNARVIWSDESFFILFPTSGRVCFWRTSKKACYPECLVPAVKYGEGSVMV